MNKEEIKTIDDLENLLGEDKVSELFMQHYIKNMGLKLKIGKELEGLDLFNIG
jgi:hypothetical protein